MRISLSVLLLVALTFGLIHGEQIIGLNEMRPENLILFKDYPRYEVESSTETNKKEWQLSINYSIFNSTANVTIGKNHIFELTDQQKNQIRNFAISFINEIKEMENIDKIVDE